MSRSTPRHVALVLAGSRGLGFASASALSESAIPVAICGRTRNDVDSAAGELSRRGPALGIVGDVSDAEQLHMVVERVRAELGPIGILIANAGGPAAGNFADITTKQWEAAYRLTVMSFVNAVTYTLPDMRSLGWGRIILIGSSSIRRPVPNLVLSNTFRPALNGLVKDLAVALAAENITVNVVAPGRIDTDRVRQLDARTAERQGSTVDEVREASEQSIPMGRYGTARELGALVGFLSSPEAGYITGQSVFVDGGLTASQP